MGGGVGGRGGGKGEGGKGKRGGGKGEGVKGRGEGALGIGWMGRDGQEGGQKQGSTWCQNLSGFGMIDPHMIVQ